MTPNKVQSADKRLPFQEVMKLVPLRDRTDGDGKLIKRYMSQRCAWVPGCDLPFNRDDSGSDKPAPFKLGAAAYGGHVYSQSGMAASRAFRETRANGSSNKIFGIHTIHGYFPEAGLVDRPFIYEVTTVADNPSFPNLFVSVRQPKTKSENPEGDHYSLADAELPLGPVCFTALVSFRPSGPSQLDSQEPSPHTRFRDILNSRPPSSWNPAPHIDIDAIEAMFPTREPGTFPAVDVRKVDMAAWNEGKPVYERRELLLYRTLAPLPASDPDSHIMTHAFEADRNGLLMIGNHAGFGFKFGRAASLSYSFVVHVNPEDAVMQYGDDEWWIQEACFPRVEVGRGIIMSKIWSPKRVHVATEYQDGIIRRTLEASERKEKL